jgi:uncharacterized protein (TIGR02145 family)
MRTYILALTLLAFFPFLGHAQTVSDYDGNVYHIITIGTGQWLQENLNTTHFSNGDAIPAVDGAPGWYTLYTPAYCHYHDSISYASVYGKMYNWFAVADSRNLCPTGWHVPTNAEWNALDASLGGSSVSGGKLKETGMTHWDDPNTGASNSTGFTGLPSGNLSSSGAFNNLHRMSFYWSSTADDGVYSWSMNLEYDSPFCGHSTEVKRDGMAVRCKSGNPSGLNETENITFAISPNPASSFLDIALSSNQEAQLEIVSIIGEVLVRSTIYNGQARIDISQIPAGIYAVRVISEDGEAVRKIVKE